MKEIKPDFVWQENVAARSGSTSQLLENFDDKFSAFNAMFARGVIKFVSRAEHTDDLTVDNWRQRLIVRFF